MILAAIGLLILWYCCVLGGFNLLIEGILRKRLWSVYLGFFVLAVVAIATIGLFHDLQR